MINLAVLWAVGLVAAVPAVFWFARDLSRIPSPTWLWTAHHRTPWQQGVIVGWIAGGWPAIVIVLVWSQSAVRRDLHDEIDYRREERHSR